MMGPHGLGVHAAGRCRQWTAEELCCAGRGRASPRDKAWITWRQPQLSWVEHLLWVTHKAMEFKFHVFLTLAAATFEICSTLNLEVANWI